MVDAVAHPLALVALVILLADLVLLVVVLRVLNKTEVLTIQARQIQRIDHQNPPAIRAIRLHQKQRLLVLFVVALVVHQTLVLRHHATVTLQANPHLLEVLHHRVAQLPLLRLVLLQD